VTGRSAKPKKITAVFDDRGPFASAVVVDCGELNEWFSIESWRRAVAGGRQNGDTGHNDMCSHLRNLLSCAA
jgi:hypothetical protein